MKGNAKPALFSAIISIFTWRGERKISTATYF